MDVVLTIGESDPFRGNNEYLSRMTGAVFENNGTGTGWTDVPGLAKPARRGR